MSDEMKPKKWDKEMSVTNSSIGCFEDSEIEQSIELRDIYMKGFKRGVRWQEETWPRIERDELQRKFDIAKNALHQTWSWLDSEGLADESPGEFKWLIKEVLKEIEG